MFRLKLPTDPRWVNIVEKNIEEILTDHAFCEQKAATNAITIVVKFPEKTDLVTAMLELAQEELSHFQQVHQKLIERGFVLGKERRDEYVNLLYDFQLKQREWSSVTMKTHTIGWHLRTIFKKGNAPAEHNDSYQRPII